MQIFFPVSIFVVLLLQYQATHACTTVFINEFHYDNDGTDIGEFVELAGPAGTDLTGWSIALYNGNDGTSYNTISLSGTLYDQIGGYGFFVIDLPSNSLHNGPVDGFALVDSSNNVVQILSYEGSFIASEGPAAGQTSIDIGINQPSTTSIGSSLQLTGTGSDSGICYENFTWTSGAETKGLMNVDQTFPNQGDTCVTVFINEFHYDNDGMDLGEFVEVAGPAGTDLTGWSLVLYNGSSGSSYKTISLSGILSDQTGGYGFHVIEFPSYGLQNGSPNGFGLVDSSDRVIQFLSYEGSFVATEGQAVGQTSVDVGVNESSTTSVGSSLQLAGIGSNGRVCYEDFTWMSGDETKSASNRDQFFGQRPDVEVCGESFTAIYTIQGSGFVSPMLGEEVYCQGIVTGDFQGSDQLDGFFIQDPTGDGDPLTSDGIFIYAPDSVDVNLGDLVRVRGIVDEIFNLTAIKDVSYLSICSSGNSYITTTLNLPVNSIDDFESYEGMLVTFPETLTVTDNYNLGRFGELLLSVDGRLYISTNRESPGPDSNALLVENKLRQILLDDFSTTQNPNIVPYLDKDMTRRVGSTVSGLTGILSYGFSSYRLQPTSPLIFNDDNPRSSVPVDVGGAIKVASFNVLNYFNDIDDSSCPINAGCRGADSREEFSRQRAKIFKAIAAIDADIVGLIEVENNGYGEGSAIQDFLDGVNREVGADVYNVLDLGAPLGTDAIAVAFIYKPAVVSAVGNPSILDSTVDARFLDDKNRPALAQTFEGQGVRFVVALNHFKSKGSACDDVGDPDVGDGQGNCNGVRTDAANALVDWLSTDPTGAGVDNILVIGDLNSYAKEDPIIAIKTSEYTDLVEDFVGAGAYSYVFKGESGYLDHALASSGLLSLISGVTVWHINADEPRFIDYNTEFNTGGLYSNDAFRASDHDPVIVGIQGNEVVLPSLRPTSASNSVPTSSLLTLTPAPVPSSIPMENILLLESSGAKHFGSFTVGFLICSLCLLFNDV